eukprot:c11761_g1_i2 orf=176-550(+)
MSSAASSAAAMDASATSLTTSSLLPKVSCLGGETDVKNCQILQSRVNRFKGDKEHIGKEDLEQSSCNLKFTDKELDVIEMAVYGDVIRPGLQCKCKSVGETLGVAIKAKGPAMASCELPYQKVE